MPTWSIYAVHRGDNAGRLNSVVDMQVPGATAEQALDSIEYKDDVIADHGENCLYFVVREDHVPGRGGKESVSHDHRLLRFDTSPRVVDWDA